MEIKENKKSWKSGRILVTRSSLPPLEEYVDEIRDLWESHWITNMGAKHEELREALRAYLGAEHLELFTNGHMAIELSLQAMELPEGSEVITTPFTFASTTHAIVRNGLQPVFCDIDPETFVLDPAGIDALITDRTAAILPVHVYGNLCDVDAIGQIAQKYGLKVIYDAAHAFGEEYRGHQIGEFGDASCFSFHATKVYNTIEGGAVAYRDESFGRLLYRLKNFGIRDAETVDGIGANAKMNEFCAAMGLCNLRHLPEKLKSRKEAAERYRERLEGVPGLRLLKPKDGLKQNYAYFPVVFNEKEFGATRNDVFAALDRAGIGARKYFYPLTSSYTCYQGRFDPGQTPVALHISKRVLTLPLYADMDPRDIDRICSVVLSCGTERKTHG